MYARICKSGVPEFTKYTLLPINFWDEFVFDPYHQTMSRIARKPEVIDKKMACISTALAAWRARICEVIFLSGVPIIFRLCVCGGGGGKGEDRECEFISELTYALRIVKIRL